MKFSTHWRRYWKEHWRQVALENQKKEPAMVQKWLFTHSAQGSETIIGIGSGESLDEATEKLIECNNAVISTLPGQEIKAYPLRDKDPVQVDLSGTQTFIC